MVELQIIIVILRTKRELKKKKSLAVTTSKSMTEN